MRLRAHSLTTMLAGVALGLGVASGCHGRGTRDAQTSRPLSDLLTSLDGARFEWLQAECNDGALDLASLGFERSLTLHSEPESLVLTFDTQLATRGCTQTSVWSAQPATKSNGWRFEPQAVVSLPPQSACGATESQPMYGNLHLHGDELELVTQHSPWCRGFDARFVYHRAAPRPLTVQEIVLRYVAHFDRGDADAVARLFEDDASLVEPFTRTSDGNYARHEGRDAVRAWYAAAFSGMPWHAMRLLALSSHAPEQVVLDWEYMDANLQEPLRGRNLFVMVEGEIYETEVQLVSDPVTRVETGAPAPAKQAVP